MIGLENKDTSFFTVESPDIRLQGEDFNKNLISFTINEKMGGLPTGTLTFNDPKHRFSHILRTGVTLRLSWGYRSALETPDSLIEKRLNFDEISGSMVRRGVEGFVSSPSGGGSSGGAVTYNCNFTSWGLRGPGFGELFTSGNKASVIHKSFDSLGISPSKRYIDFTLATDPLSLNKYVRQEESTFAFLNRMALEWQAFFHIAFSPDGEPIGIFLDRNKILKSPLPGWVLDGAGSSNAIGWKGDLNNVISYTWSSSESDKGNGDNVQMDIVDGQIIFRRYTAESEKVITWKLNQKAIQDVFAEAGAEGAEQQLKLTQDLLSKNDFEEIKHFFTPVENTTAPDGFGYRLKCKMIGNPTYIPGNIIVVKNGFPSRIGNDQTIWYIHSVNHAINRSGYMMDIEVVDVFNLSPIGLPVL